MAASMFSWIVELNLLWIIVILLCAGVVIVLVGTRLAGVVDALIPISDVAYRNGSIYHAITSETIFLAAVTIIMTSVLLMGLLRGEESGIAKIYAGMLAKLLFA